MSEHPFLFGIAQRIASELENKLRRKKDTAYGTQIFSDPIRHTVTKKGIGDKDSHPIVEIFDRSVNNAVPGKFAVRVKDPTHLEDVILPILKDAEKEKNITFEVVTE